MATNEPSSPLSLPNYVYGTTRLGDDAIPFEDRVNLARAAYAQTGWIHTSHQYGDALKVLRAAFDADRTAVPNAFFKIGWSSPEEVRGQVDLQCEALDIPAMTVGQLCPGGALAEDIATGGPGIAGLQRLRDEGRVGRFVLEVWPWTSDTVLRALRGGHLNGFVDAIIFYLNPLQRFVTNELWDAATEIGFPIVAMRTVSGGNVHQLAQNPDAPAYLRERAQAVAPLFDASGLTSWAQFSAQYSLNLPNVLATVGATSRRENLAEFLAGTATRTPLPADIVNQILALQREWSDHHDRHAAPWSM